MYVPPRPGDIREPLLFCENVEVRSCKKKINRSLTRGSLTQQSVTVFGSRSPKGSRSPNDHAIGRPHFGDSFRSLGRRPCGSRVG